MKTALARWVFVLVAVILLASLIISVDGQRRNTKKRKGNKRKPQRAATPTPTEGGRWIPRKQRIANANRRRKQQANKNKQTTKSRGGSRNFEDIISPPLYRSAGGPDLQKPSWPHCEYTIQVDEDWASFMSPGYPRNISGQIQCTWMIYGIRGMRLRLSFNDLDLQDGNGGRCGNQFVDVIDLELLNSQGKFCGSLIPGDYVSVGRAIRIDIQGDTTIEPHKGFQAAVKSVSLSVPAGRRQRSTMYHGLPTTSRRPPIPFTYPTTTRQTVVMITTTRSITTTRTRRRSQIIYGPNLNQPSRNNEIKTISTGTPDTTIILYVIIGIFCLLVVMTAIGFIFRKRLYAKYKSFIRNRKSRKAEVENSENDEKENGTKDKEDRGSENAAFSRGCFELPESMAGTPSLDGRRRRSVVFEDEVLAGLVREPIPRNASADDFSGDAESEVSKSQLSISTLPQANFQGNFQGWNYPKGEPIYEDDTMSVQSFSSVRSASRHPDHATFKQKKIMEKNKVLLGEEENVYAAHSDQVFTPGMPRMPPMMPHQFNPMLGYGGRQHMFPPFDPRLGYPMMTQQHNQFAVRPTQMPVSYHDPQNGPQYPRFGNFHPNNTHGSVVDYPLGNAPTSHHQRSQDDINLHRSRENLGRLEMPGVLRPARSMTDLNGAPRPHIPELANLKSTQSMAELPLDSAFLKRKLERSHSFCL